MTSSRHRYVPARNRRLDSDEYATLGRVGFFTIRAYRRSIPFVVAELNEAILSILFEERVRLGMQLYAYCLMPDHLHMLIGLREDGPSMLAFVNQFKGKSTRVSWTHGRRGKLWQPRSYDHLVRRSESLRSIAEYIIANPVRRGLVESSDAYRWGGLLDSVPL